MVSVGSAGLSQNVLLGFVPPSPRSAQTHESVKTGGLTISVEAELSGPGRAPVFAVLVKVAHLASICGLHLARSPDSRNGLVVWEVGTV